MNFIRRFSKIALKKLYVLLGGNLISNSRKKYDDYQTLEQAEIKVFSQNGEDGIIDYLKETYLKNIKDSNLEEAVNYNFSKSRDKDVKLTYLKKMEALKLIKECDLIDLSNPNNQNIKIKDLYNI